MHPNKRQKILSILSIPPTFESDTLISVASCGPGSPSKLNQSAGTGLFQRIQSGLKKFGSIYSTLVATIGPVLPTTSYDCALKHILKQYDSKSVIINYGSGPGRIDSRDDIINVDIFSFRNVDLHVDTDPIPLRPSTVDLVLSIAVLEHVKNPQDMVSEIYRVLKPSGRIFCFVPFMQPIHSAPADYYRWTPEGLRELFAEFEAIEVFSASGPSSSLAWLFAIWLASIFSLGNKTLFSVLYLLILPIIFPLKLIDRIFPWMEKSTIASSGFYLICSKQ